MNRSERRRQEREKDGNVKIKGWTEHETPASLKQHKGKGWFSEMNKVFRKSDNQYVVMTRELTTEWGLIIHACMRNMPGTDIPWAEKQQIKNELFGKESQAIEVYPKESQLVDAANMYHIWILPAEMKIPFTLKEKKA